MSEGYPTHEGSDTAYDASLSSAVVLSVPGSAAIGEVLVAVVFTDYDGGTTQWSDNVTGWTMYREEGDTLADNYSGIYWRVVDGTEDASYTFTPAGGAGTRDMAGRMMRFSDVDNDQPFDSVEGAYTQWGFGGNPTFAGFAVSDDYSLVMCLTCLDGSLGSMVITVGDPPWSKYSEQNADNGGSFTLFEYELETAGASTAISTNPAGNENGHGFQFALSYGVVASGGGASLTSENAGPGQVLRTGG